MTKRKILSNLCKTALLCIAATMFNVSFARDVWTPKQANDWYSKLPYLAGVNYVPSYAVNGIELWSDETFDIKTIEHEFKLLKSINMNCIRLFLNDQVHKHNPEAFYAKMQQVLDLCDKYDVYVMFTFYSNGGRPEGKLGKQPEPVAGKHNSQWVKCPTLSVLGDESKWGYLKDYVQGTVKRFANNPRIIWDIFNEPGNIPSSHVPGQKNMTKDEYVNYIFNTKKLMEKSFEWARAANPTQPLTACVWECDKFTDTIFAESSLTNSDIITYHCYESVVKHTKFISRLKQYKKPIMCTEWLARQGGSTFDPVLQFLKANKIGSFSFGLKQGKIQTHLAWPWFLNSGLKGVEDIWFHDIFDSNDQPYSKEEVAYIKRVLSEK